MTTVVKAGVHSKETDDDFIQADALADALQGFNTTDDFFPNSPTRLTDAPDDDPDVTSRPASPPSDDDNDNPNAVTYSEEHSHASESSDPTSENRQTTPQEAQPRVVEKLRICLASTSPSSVSSSSSEPEKRRKKRHCITCNIHFRHKGDLLAHLRSHVTQPQVQLVPLDPDTNRFYRDFLRQEKKAPTLSVRTDLSTEPGCALKLKLKIDKLGATNPNTNTEPERIIHVLSPRAIKRSPEHRDTPLDAMVALTEMTFETSDVDGSSSSDANYMQVAEPDRVHFECPTLDGLDQFNSDESEAAQMLKRLLESPQEPTDTEWAGSSSNEFMSIDKLMHICTVCHSNFADAVLLYEHKRLTGHEFPKNMPMNPPQKPHPPANQQQQQQRQQQPMHMQNNNQFGPPRGNTFPQQNPMMMYRQPMARARGPGPMPNGPHPPPSYGQPAVLPLNQMQHQIRTFQMHQQARFGVPIRQPYIDPSHQQAAQQPLPVRRTPPPLYRVQNHQNGPNGQPLNMAPFMGMNPDMYNPVPGVHAPNGNNALNPNHPQRMNQPRISPLQRMQQHPHYQQHPGSNASGPSPPITPPHAQNVQLMRPPNPFYPPNNKRPMAPVLQTRFRVNPNPQANPSPPNVTMTGRALPPNLAKRPKLDSADIVMAPPTDGLPIIKSVQGAAGKPITNPSLTHNLSDQITLSVKPKESSTTPISSQNNAKAVADILTNRGITVKPTAKSTDRHRENPSPCGSNASADDSSSASSASGTNTAFSVTSSTSDAVQKIQLNSSISIISKKRPAPSTAPVSTIDLSNDDDDKPPPVTPPSRPFHQCMAKGCSERFVTQEGLTRHMIRVHRANVRLFRCKFCPAKFATNDSLQLHQRKAHRLAKTTADELGLPVVDLNNDDTRRKLAALGIVNYIPLGNLNRVTDGSFGLPIVSVAGSANSAIFNMGAIGADSLLSLGPIKQIPKRPADGSPTASRVLPVQRHMQMRQPGAGPQRHPMAPPSQRLRQPSPMQPVRPQTISPLTQPRR